VKKKKEKKQQTTTKVPNKNACYTSNPSNGIVIIRIKKW